MCDILDVSGKLIPIEWQAEFRGFFLGEGSLQIQRYRRHRFHAMKSRGKIYEMEWAGLRPVACVCLRDDDRAVLDAIQSVLGGHVNKHNAKKIISPRNGRTYVSRPMVQWKVTSSADVQRVIDILKPSVLPASKLHEVEIMQRYLDIRPGPGHKWTDEIRTEMWSLFEQIKAAREYHE